MLLSPVIDDQFADVQAADAEFVDLDDAEARAPDRQPADDQAANGQRAHSNSSDRERSDGEAADRLRTNGLGTSGLGANAGRWCVNRRAFSHEFLHIPAVTKSAEGIVRAPCGDGFTGRRYPDPTVQQNGVRQHARRP